jgi:hypothetical protein
MKLKHLYLIFGLYIYIYNNAQNLIPNSSFEAHFDCSYTGIESSSPWCGINSVAYLNACMTGSLSVPTQSWSPGYPSYQVPHLGNAYASFGYIWPTITANSRYPHVPLLDTLKAGTIYCVTYYISLWNDCRFSSDKFGALFTATPFNCAAGSQNLYTGYTPQVVSTPGVLYDDTLNWMEVSGAFTATGTEAYLTIGNFFPNAQHTYSVSYPGGVRQLAEYYLDDVSVEEVDIARAKNDTLIMQGDSVIIGANLGEANLYNWQPTAGLSCTNCPNPKASPTVTTTYTVTKTQCHVTTSDVITVSVSPTGLFDLLKEQANIKIYPNPNTGSFTLSYLLKNNVNANVEIMDIAGRLIYQNKLTSQADNLNIQLSNVNNGIYFLKISNGKELISVHKVIVNH